MWGRARVGTGASPVQPSAARRLGVDGRLGPLPPQCSGRNIDAKWRNVPSGTLWKFRKMWVIILEL